MVDFDGVTQDEFPFYDFSMKLGGDLVLDPGEQLSQWREIVSQHFGLGLDLGAEGYRRNQVPFEDMGQLQRGQMGLRGLQDAEHLSQPGRQYLAVFQP